jgi:prephenate dehydrogenase
MGETFQVGKIAILGAGLIGGSLLQAILKRGLADRVAVYDFSAPARDLVAQKNWPSVTVAASPQEAAEGAAVVFLCVSSGRTLSLARQIADSLAPTAIVTDVCSVKGAMVHAIDDVLKGKALWVGGHPMAGRERGGLDASDAELFAGRKTILTPTRLTAPGALADVSAFWRAVGAQVVLLSPEQHDHRVAQISHLPHLVASVLAQSVEEESLAVAGPGFRDATRIAAAPADLWQEILLSNKDEVIACLERLVTDLQRTRTALILSDEAELYAILKRANEMRKKLDPPAA